jgi:hypothetical protein
VVNFAVFLYSSLLAKVYKTQSFSAPLFTDEANGYDPPLFTDAIERSIGVLLRLNPFSLGKGPDIYEHSV